MNIREMEKRIKQTTKAELGRELYETLNLLKEEQDRSRRLETAALGAKADLKKVTDSQLALENKLHNVRQALKTLCAVKFPDRGISDHDPVNIQNALVNGAEIEKAELPEELLVLRHLYNLTNGL
jgi:hypothetical protein